MLYRVFPHLAGARPDQLGGPLHTARDRQGMGRHDNPDHYAALYASRSAESAVAERIQAFRGQTLSTEDLRRANGAVLALAALDDSALGSLVDLDEPRELVRRSLRPSRLATGERAITQRLALGIFDEGGAGLSWWSVLEASWTNVTLFAARVRPMLRVDGRPEALSTDHPVVRSAAERLGIRLRR